LFRRKRRQGVRVATALTKLRLRRNQARRCAFVGDVAPAPPEVDQILRESIMGLLLLIIILILLFGGGGGYYGYRTFGGPGLGGVLGLIVVILIVLWLVGGLGPYTTHV
jgi:hypothetical protein